MVPVNFINLAREITNKVDDESAHNELLIKQHCQRGGFEAKNVQNMLVCLAAPNCYLSIQPIVQHPFLLQILIVRCSTHSLL